ncbi:MAG: flagellar biosynthesis regulator FlaF [Paracoccaceae bacterium]
MSLHSLALNAYARPEGAARSPRSIEYDLFARTTQRLSASWTARDRSFPAFAEALNDNLRLWRALAVDVAQPGNGLPEDLRARLYHLYKFVAQHSRKLLKREEATVEVLVDINTAVMRGLRGEGGAP